MDGDRSTPRGLYGSLLLLVLDVCSNGTKTVHRGKFKCQRHSRGQLKGTKATTSMMGDSDGPASGTTESTAPQGPTLATTPLLEDKTSTTVASPMGNAEAISGGPAGSTTADTTVTGASPRPNLACDFVVTFSGMISRGAHYPACYVVKTVNLNHGHELDPPLLLPSTTTAKTVLSELTPDEMNVVREHHKHDAVRLVQILHEKYGFEYTASLM
jgi:hypothetical protein